MSQSTISIAPKDNTKVGRNVLCMDRHETFMQGILDSHYGIQSIRAFDFAKVHSNNFHWMNTSVVDSKGDVDSLESLIAHAYPQVNGYIVVTHKDKVLSYARKVSNEERLLNSRSIGFGGHCEIEDIVVANYSSEVNYHSTLMLTASRELEEELGLSLVASSIYDPKALILDTVHNKPNDNGVVKLAVGLAHVGMLLHVELTDDQAHNLLEMHALQIDAGEAEAQELRWHTVDELLEDLDLYESWSKILINEFKLNGTLSLKGYVA